MKRLFLSGMFGVIFTAVLIFSAANLANAAIVIKNIGFETGDLTGWTISGSGSANVVTSYVGGSHTYLPPDGNYFLTLSVTSGSLSVSQSFTATQNDILSGYAGLYAGPGTNVALTFTISSFATPIWAATSSTSGWQPWTWTAPAAGTYTLQYTLIGNSPSTAVFDAVPIPTTALLLCSGLIGLVIIRRRVKK